MKPIILFDGLCPLCSAGARFVARRDRARRFRLGAIQSPAGAALARAHGIDPDDPATMLLIEDGRARRDSDAVLAVLEGLGGPWRIARLARRLPVPLRDAVYRWVARNRFRLTGRRRTCQLPDPRDPERWL